MLFIGKFTYSEQNSLQNVISRVTVFLTDDSKMLTNNLKKDDKKIINDTMNSKVEGDLLNILEKKLPIYGKHLKKLDTKYNLKYNLLSQESKNFVIEIESIIAQDIISDKDKLDKFIKETLIPKYSKLTEASKTELKYFYNKSKGIQMAAAKSGLL
uniref:DUF2059 domain-containing protein n=1 Tax=Strongyloides venezuelensis TaxID=75913 RepID=A0A0K0FTP0_STRVS